MNALEECIAHRNAMGPGYLDTCLGERMMLWMSNFRQEEPALWLILTVISVIIFSAFLFDIVRAMWLYFNEPEPGAEPVKYPEPYPYTDEEKQEYMRRFYAERRQDEKDE